MLDVQGDGGLGDDGALDETQSLLCGLEGEKIIYIGEEVKITWWLVFLYLWELHTSLRIGSKGSLSELSWMGEFVSICELGRPFAFIHPSHPVSSKTNRNDGCRVE